MLANPLTVKYGIKFAEEELVEALVEALKTGCNVPRAAAAAAAVE